MISSEIQKSKIRQSWAEEMLKILGYKVTVTGKIQAKTKSFILVGNHISFLDIPVIMAVCPSVVFVAKEDLKKWPVLGVCIAAAGTIFISRKVAADRSQAREKIGFSLKNKSISVAVFPSGTTTLDEKVAWKKGIFEIAKKTKVPIQTFHIQYKPLRQSAYIDDDNFISKIGEISKTKNKSVQLNWLQCYEEVDSPSQLSETIQKTIQNYQKRSSR